MSTAPEGQDGSATSSVTVYPDGPLLLRGEAEVRTAAGEVLSSGGRPVALCRCGHSATVPFCDGTHKSAKFRAPAAKPPATPAS